MLALSLGWGVQSFTLAAMSALGEVPMLDVAIHSDTQHEMSYTYKFAEKWTPWLQERGVNVVTVVYEGRGGTDVIIDGDNGLEVRIPAFSAGENRDRGRLRRQCTSRWKISPLRKWLQEHRGDSNVELWLGITLDEYQRAKDADVNYITHAFPLLDMKFTRQDCIDWLTEKGIEVPGKSTCTFCPFHTRPAWKEMREENGADWRDALAVDEMIRSARPPQELFLHSKLQPLTEATESKRILTLFDKYESDDKDAECDSAHCFL